MDQQEATHYLAALVFAAKRLGASRVSLGISNLAVDALVASGGVPSTSLFPTHAIESVDLTVDGLSIYAQREERSCTANELESVAKSAADNDWGW